MRYQHENLEKISTFLKDFGMRTVKKTEDKIWFGGYGVDPYVYVAEKGAENKYLGGAFLVESFGELEKAAKLEGAGEIVELTDAPGGGHSITIQDPEGFPVNLIYGQTPTTANLPEKLIYNYEADKPRTASFQRFKQGPAAVHKLGHFGLCVTQFPSQVEFYTKTFNLVPSDILQVGEKGKEKDVAVFLHIDRGEEFVDHHSYFMSSNPTGHVHHCSFEVHDFDTQVLGHKWLAEKGYKNVWGVGRHILGSQLFDYWWDTSEFMVEHYADGDLVNDTLPIGYGPAGHESLAVWGPETPATFLD